MRIYVKWFCYSKLLLSTIWGYFEISLVLPVPVLLIVITNYLDLILKYLSYINDRLFFWDSTLQDTYYISGIVRDNSIDSIRRQLKFNSNWFKDTIFLSESDISRLYWLYVYNLSQNHPAISFLQVLLSPSAVSRSNQRSPPLEITARHAELVYGGVYAIFLHIDIGNRIFFVKPPLSLFLTPIKNSFTCH